MSHKVSEIAIYVIFCLTIFIFFSIIINCYSHSKEKIAIKSYQAGRSFQYKNTLFTRAEDDQSYERECSMKKDL